MKPKTMILMVVAVVCGLVASYMTSQLIANRNATAEEKPMTKVLVAKKKIPSMTALAKPQDWLVEKDFPQDLVPKKAILTFEGLKDKRLSKSMNEDTIITQDDLVTKDSEGLAVEVPPGHRAVGLKVNREALVGGFVLPRSRVDVMAVTREGEPESKTILQDMLVLAVDTNSERNLENGKSMLGATVTLAATPEESQRVFLAQTMGELRLLLRGVGDRERATLKGTTRKDFGKPLSTPETGPSIAETSAGPTATVKIPELPEVAAPTQPVVEPAKTDPVIPEEAPLKTHTLTLVVGDNIQQVKFFQDKDGNWEKGAGNRSDLDEPRQSKKSRPGSANTPAEKPQKNTDPVPLEAGSK